MGYFKFASMLGVFLLRGCTLHGSHIENDLPFEVSYRIIKLGGHDVRNGSIGSGGTILLDSRLAEIDSLYFANSSGMKCKVDIKDLRKNINTVDSGNIYHQKYDQVYLSKLRCREISAGG